jgi:hypothetical protein
MEAGFICFEILFLFARFWRDIQKKEPFCEGSV